MLGRFPPALREIKDDTERAAAQELPAKMFKSIDAEAASTASQLKQLDIAIGNAKEAFGEIIAEAVRLFVG